MLARIKFLFSASIIIFSLSLVGLGSAHAQHVLKTSVLAPKGSTWVNVLEQMSKELDVKSNGALKLKIYAGGVSGDELTVLKKMKIGQIHMAGFTGVGLGAIDKSVRVLELPFLFSNHAQVDAGKKAITSDLNKNFKSKGFVILAWSDAGFVNIFSNKAIKKASDLEGVKMWVWQGDPLARAMADAVGISPIPLAITDVYTSLQTKLIDAVYGPPAAVVALQWFTKTKYMTELKMANSAGAIVISNKAFNKLPNNLKTLLKTTSAKYSKILTQKIRQENQRAVATLKNNGIQVIQMEAAELAKLKNQSKKVHKQMIGKLYPASLLQKVEAAIQ